MSRINSFRNDVVPEKGLGDPIGKFRMTKNAVSLPGQVAKEVFPQFTLVVVILG